MVSRDGQVFSKLALLVRSTGRRVLVIWQSKTGRWKESRIWLLSVAAGPPFGVVKPKESRAFSLFLRMLSSLRPCELGGA